MAAAVPANNLTIRYLGIAGWQLQTPEGSLLIDPVFTRLSLWQTLTAPAVPDEARIAARTPPADAIFISHPHHDHIMDTPHIAAMTGAHVYASAQGCDLLAVLGLSADQMTAITPGDRLAVGPFVVEVFPSAHRIIFGRVPYQGALREGLRPPLYARDYRMREQFSFCVEAGGERVLVISGIDDEPRIPADVVLVGADASRAQLTPILRAAQPALVMPNHWDDMFRPLDVPLRPMLSPPRHLLSIPRRIDLAAWAERVQMLAPAAKILIPDRFAPIAVSD